MNVRSKATFTKKVHAYTIRLNKTRQGYARKCTLKLAGYFFLLRKVGFVI